LYDQGKRATEILLALLAGRKVPRREILPTELVIRRSCGCMEIPRPPSEDARFPRGAGKTPSRRPASRRGVIAQLVRSAGSAASGLSDGWANRLLTACETAARELRSEAFLPVWDEILRQAGAAGADVVQWHVVLDVLCRHALRSASAGKRKKAMEAMWQDARSMISDVSRWAQAFQRKQAERHAFEFTARISEPLMTAFDLDELTDVIAQQLPRMGIQSCYLSLYEPSVEGAAGCPSPWARLILAYDGRGRRKLEPGGRRFAARELVPAGVLPAEERFAILLEPLHFREKDQLGFIAFAPLRPEAGILREALSRLISTAIKGALLSQERQKTEETLHQREESQQAFAERVTRVLDMINQLSKIESFEVLCRRSVELALDRLGFDRIGLCFLSEDYQTVLGVYGTDETGRLRDEHHLRRPIGETPTIRRLLENPEPVIFFRDEILLDDHLTQVGVGHHAVARLWNGEKITGFYAVDNLLRQTPIRDEDLRILVLYGTAMGHLFTLKRAEASLRQSESKFRSLFEQAAVGVAQMDTRTGTFLEVNRRFCEIVGRTADPMMNLTLEEITHPEDYAIEQEKITAFRAGSLREYSLDKRLCRADGSFVWVHQTLSTVQSAGEAGDFSTMVIQDISERRQAEEALRQYSEHLEEMVEDRTRELRDTQEQLIRQEKLSILGKLAGGVGHELRNPLGVMSNAIYFLKMKHADADPSTREYLDLLSQEVRNAEKIVSDLLDFSRIRVVEREKIEVAELIARVLERQPPPPNIHVAVTVGFEPPSVWVDPRHMVQVFSNLVTNAFQAMPDGGELMIRAERAGNKTRIQVADTGCGISPENLDKVFEPLFTTRARGIGLGLAISKSLVESNNGTITVESEAGKGTTFTILLPAPGSE
jgi:PAS domain S-box-containing protein